MKTIAQRCMRFQADVMDPDAPQLQRDEMRLAFFAGAKAMIDATMEIAELNELAAIVALECFHLELRAFGVRQR